MLILKVECPTKLNDYRPISLCNTIYKVISKLLAERIKPLLPNLIFPNQCAFVKGRHIGENMMIAKELLHSIRMKKGKHGLVILKLDMEKAYDCLEWSFTKNVLLNFGFLTRFVDWILQCVTTSSATILLNGNPCSKFSPQRELSDPISPYLYSLQQDLIQIDLES